MARDSVLLFGTYDASRNPRAEIIVEGLGHAGYDISRCLAPLNLSAESRLSLFRHPFRNAGRYLGLVAVWLRLLVRSLRCGSPGTVVVGYVAHVDVLLARVRFPRATVVMDHLVPLQEAAYDRGTRRGAYTALLGFLDRLATRVSDIVVVDTEEHLETLSPAARSKAVVVPVGALGSSFAPGAPGRRRGEGALRVIFFGNYIPLQGAPVIGDAIRVLHERRRGLEVTMVGAGQDLAETRRRADGAGNVTWVDTFVDRAVLDDLIRQHDVALGIFGTTPKAARVVPTKVFESAAAGLALVTGDTPPQRRALDGAAVFVPVGDGVALADALEALADDRERLERMTEAARTLAAGRFRPQAVIRPLVERLPSRGSAAPPAQPAPPLPPLPPLTVNAWHRWAVISSVLDDLAPRRVLEVGPGKGALAARLADRARYVGLETDPTAAADTAQAVRGRAGDPAVPAEVVADSEAAAERGPFDLVIACEVLEHIDDDTSALTAWASMVAPGGAVILSVPAHRKRYGPWDERVGHFRRYDREDVEAVVARAGLTLSSCTPTGWPLGYALEQVWNRAAQVDPGHGSVEDRTAGSSRNLQPRGGAGTMRRLASVPGTRLQRLVRGTDLGIGWVVVARR